MKPPRGVTPRLVWLLIQVRDDPRPELWDFMEDMLQWLEEAEGRLPTLPAGAPIAALFREANRCYEQALHALAAEIEQIHPGRWQSAWEAVEQGAALIEQADAQNYRLLMQARG